MALVVCAVTGCSRNVELLSGSDGGGGAPASCGGTVGPAIRLPSGASLECASTLASAGHRFALCTCDALVVSSPLATDAFDSTGLTAGSTTTAAVGTNGDFSTMNNVTIGGALFVAGTDKLITGDPLMASESLHAAGAIEAGAQLTVGTDAFASGDVNGSVTVAGALHVPAGAMVGGSVSSASVVREPVTVAAPCDCLPGSFPDLGQAMASAMAANDDAVIGLSPQAPAPSMGTLDLPCGTYVVDRVELTSDLSLQVHGRVALFVRGDVSLPASLKVVLDPGAELDLIVGGAFTLSGGHTFGSATQPARIRLWMASSDEHLLLRDDPLVGAVVDAPRAAVDAPAGVELAGSLVARRFTFGGNVTVHYDRAVLSSGGVCGAPTQPAVH